MARKQFKSKNSTIFDKCVFNEPNPYLENKQERREVTLTPFSQMPSQRYFSLSYQTQHLQDK